MGVRTIKPTETVARNTSVTLAPSQTKAGSFVLNHGLVDKTLLNYLTHMTILRHDIVPPLRGFYSDNRLQHCLFLGWHAAETGLVVNQVPIA